MKDFQAGDGSRLDGGQARSAEPLTWEDADFVEFGVREFFRGILDREVPHAFAVGREMSLEVAEDVPQVVRGLVAVLDLVLTRLVVEALDDSRAGRADLRVSFHAGAHSAISVVLTFAVRGLPSGGQVDAMGEGSGERGARRAGTGQGEGPTADGGEKGGGTGDGSSGPALMRRMAWRLVESAGGGIQWVETALGQTTVTIRFPVEVVVERSMLQGLLDGPLEARGVRALVAHADTDRRVAIRMVLEEAGLLVTEADNGYQVLGILQQAHAQDADFDVVLAAEDLPGMGGGALASAVWSDPDTGLPAVVVLRPPGAKGRAERRNGARVRFIPETVKPARLLLAVQYALSRGKRSGTAKLHRRSVITAALPLMEGKVDVTQEVGAGVGIGGGIGVGIRKVPNRGMGREEMSEPVATPVANEGALGPAGEMPARESSGSTVKMPPLLDLSMIQEMTEGDEELVRELASLFLEELDEQRAVLDEGLANDAAAQVRRGAHTIKGAAANFGAEPLRALAAALESLAKKGDLAGVRGRLTELDDVMGKTADWLRQTLDRDGGSE